MSKLLEYLKAWADSLFGAKKSFIAQQSLPNGDQVEMQFDSSGSTTAPFDGWVRASAHCDYIEVSSNNCFFIIGNQAQSWPSSTLPVKKGTLVAFGANNLASGAKIYVYFIHNQSGV